MFEDALYQALVPLIGTDFPAHHISSLATHIADLIEINPREGNQIPYLRDSILQYLESPQTISNSKRIEETRVKFATELNSVSSGLADLDKLSAQILRESLQVQVVDVKLAKEIFSLNFGYKQNLGEIIETCKNTKGTLGFV